MPVKHTICAILFWGGMHVGFPFASFTLHPPALLERLSLVWPSTSTEVAFANAELQYQGFRA